MKLEIKLSPGGEPIEQDVYDITLERMFSGMMATASPEIREEIMKRVQRAIECEDHCGITEPHVDWSKAVDLGDKYDGWGHYFLYVWFDSEGTPFYAGQGVDSRRPGQYTSSQRSEEFKNVIRRGGCHSVVVAKHIPKSKIDNMERQLIRYLYWRGYPVVNKKDLPSTIERRLMLETCGHTGKSIDSVFLSQPEVESGFKRVLKVLEEVTKTPWKGKCAEIAS